MKMALFIRTEPDNFDEVSKFLVILTSFSHRKHLSEVGFEPTPTFVDQNTPVRKSFTLESGALSLARPS